MLPYVSFKMVKMVMMSSDCGHLYNPVCQNGHKIPNVPYVSRDSAIYHFLNAQSK